MKNKPRNYDSPFYDENDDLELDDFNDYGEPQTSQITDFTYQNGEIFPLKGILNKPADLIISSDVSLLDTLDDDRVNDIFTD